MAKIRCEKNNTGSKSQRKRKAQIEDEKVLFEKDKMFIKKFGTLRLTSANVDAKGVWGKSH